jgi:hypothetical protein
MLSRFFRRRKEDVNKNFNDFVHVIGAGEDSAVGDSDRDSDKEFISLESPTEKEMIDFSDLSQDRDKTNFLLYLKGLVYEMEFEKLPEEVEEESYASIAKENSEKIRFWAESTLNALTNGEIDGVYALVLVKLIDDICTKFSKAEAPLSNFDNAKKMLINRWAESAAKTPLGLIGVIDGDLKQLSQRTQVSMLGALCENMANSEEIDLDVFSHFSKMLKETGGDNALQDLESVRLIDHLMEGETDAVVTILQNGDFLSHMKQVIVVVDRLISSGDKFYTHEVQRNLYKEIEETCSEQIEFQAGSIRKSLEDGKINKSEAWELVKSIDDVCTAFSEAGEPIYYFGYTKQKLLDKWAELVVNESSCLTGEIDGYLRPFSPTTQVSMVQALCKHLNGKVMNGEVEIIPNFKSFLDEIERFNSVWQDVGSLLDLATIAHQMNDAENTECLVTRAKTLVQERIEAGGDMLDIYLFLDSRAEKGKIDAPLASFMESIKGPGLIKIMDSLPNLRNLAQKVASRVRFFNKGDFNLARSDGTFDLASSAKFIRVIFASVYGSYQDSIAYSCASYGFKEAIDEIIKYQNGKVIKPENKSHLFHDMKVAMRALQGSLKDLYNLPEDIKAPIISSLEKHFIELLEKLSPEVPLADLKESLLHLEVSGFFEVAGLILPKLISKNKICKVEQLINLIDGLPGISKEESLFKFENHFLTNLVLDGKKLEALVSRDGPREAADKYIKETQSEVGSDQARGGMY